MASVKKFNGNLTIQTPVKTGTNANITLDTDFVIITGNLNVRGNTTVINSNTQTITDNIITLNQGETGNGVSTLGTTSGIEIDRGTAQGGDVQLIWNESFKTWQVSGVVSGSPGDGTQYSNIATTSGAGAISSVFDDKAPVLGGNLNVNNFTIYANVAAGTYVTLQGALNLKSANVTPTAAIGSTVFYAADTGAGQAGVFVVNPASTNEELVTKRRAFGFSLLL
jgi:hypothetical protein